RRASSTRGRRRPTAPSRSSRGTATDATSFGSRRITRSPRGPSSWRPARSTGVFPSRDWPSTKASASSTRPGRLRRGSAAHRAWASSAAATRQARLRSGSPAAARSCSCCTAGQNSARRCPTTSGRALQRYGAAFSDCPEIVELHGANGQLEAVTLKSGERLPFSFLFFFLGALPCTEWLGDVVARDENGFILTGAAANADYLLETSLPGVFPAGDVRSGSTQRCATAVGDGAMAGQLVHGRLAEHAPATTAS